MSDTTVPPTHDDELRLREVVSRASDAQSDPGRLLPLHTEDAVVVNFPGRRVLGRQALADAMAGALSSPLAAFRTIVEVVDVRFPGPDTAVVSCVKTVHDGRPDAGDALPASTGALTYVMVKRDGAWRIALAQTTPVLAAEPGPSMKKAR